MYRIVKGDGDAGLSVYLIHSIPLVLSAVQVLYKFCTSIPTSVMSRIYLSRSWIVASLLMLTILLQCCGFVLVSMRIRIQLFISNPGSPTNAVRIHADVDSVKTEVT
jgi:hypothetical protein